MTDLITELAQSLHAAWCRQMREKGFHGPDEKCSLKDDSQFTLVVPRMLCEEGKSRCDKFHRDLIPWPDLPESRRQEYLATAKAVLPEIVKGVFDECAGVCDEMDGWRTWAKVPGFEGAPTEADAAANYLSEKIRALRDRHLKELEK